MENMCLTPTNTLRLLITFVSVGRGPSPWVGFRCVKVRGVAAVSKFGRGNSGCCVYSKLT